MYIYIYIFWIPGLKFEKYIQSEYRNCLLVSFSYKKKNLR